MSTLDWKGHDSEVIRAVTIDAHGVLLLPDPEAIGTILGEFCV